MSEKSAEECGEDLIFPGSLRKRLIELGHDRLAREVLVVWNHRMRSTAGRASWPEGLIELNPELRRFGRQEIERTLLHELAHLVAYERAGLRRILPHGSEWQRACEELGIPGERAHHRLELPTRQMKRRWLYTCPGCGTELERVRRMRGTVACLQCCRRWSGGEYDDRFRLLETCLSS